MSEQGAELEQMRAGVSCAVLLECHPPPWQLDRKESTRRCLKYRRAKGEILLVNHKGRGCRDLGAPPRATSSHWCNTSIPARISVKSGKSSARSSA
jgi:hypothetical protein